LSAPFEYLGSSPAGGFSLATYNGVKAKVTDGRLYGAVAHQAGFSSIHKGGSKLSDCNISKFKAWIDQGDLNN
jgi:hypothetical protein